MLLNDDPEFQKNWESLETMFSYHLFHSNLSKACLAAVLALGLAACSSSSDNGDTAMMPEPTPEPTQPSPEPLTVDVLLSDVGLGGSVTSIDLNIAAGQSTTRGGQIFSCPASATDGCTVTFTNNAGDVAAVQVGGVTVSPVGASADMGDVPAGSSPPAVSVGSSNSLVVSARKTGTTVDTLTLTVNHGSFDEPETHNNAVDSVDVIMEGTEGWSTATSMKEGIRYSVGTSIGNPDGTPFEDVYELDDNGRIAVASDDPLIDVSRTSLGAFDVNPVPGFYDGVEGRFYCVSGGCSVRRTIAGTTGTQYLSGSVAFDPTTYDPDSPLAAGTDNSEANVPVQDSDYQNLAAWTNAAGTITGHYVTATKALSANAMSALNRKGGASNTDTAEFTYSGQATGWARLPNEGDRGSKGGTFTDDITFTAIFTSGAGGDKISGVLNPDNVGAAQTVSITRLDGMTLGRISLTLGEMDIVNFAASGGEVTGTLAAGERASDSDIFFYDDAMDNIAGTWRMQFVGDNGNVLIGDASGRATFSIPQGESPARTEAGGFGMAFGATEDTN